MSFTFTDHKVGGRLTAACDAIGAGHIRRAAGIFNEIAEDLNSEAEASSGLLAPDEDDWSAPMPPAVAKPTAQVDPADLQMCARNVHSWGEPSKMTGWRTCLVCGNVNVAPPGDSSVDISARR